MDIFGFTLLFTENAKKTLKNPYLEDLTGPTSQLFSLNYVLVVRSYSILDELP